MSISVQSLIDDTRIISGLRNNKLFTDDQIVSLLNNALNKQRDKFIASYQHWFKKSVTFTLSGGIGANTYDLTQIPDFQVDQGLTLNAGTPNPITVIRLPSFAERNAYLASGFVNGFNRRYYTDGDVLEILPATLSQGHYELVYTPQATLFSLPQFALEAATTVEAGDTYTSDGTTTTLFISDGVVGAPGDTIITSWTGNNSVFNSTYTIASLSNPQTCVVTPNGPIGTSTSPMVGANYRVGTYSQPTGTRADVPAILNPWVLYLKLHAAIAINVSRGRPCPELQSEFGDEQARIAVMAKVRSEGVAQAPITRGWRRGYGNGGY